MGRRSPPTTDSCFGSITALLIYKLQRRDEFDRQVEELALTTAIHSVPPRSAMSLIAASET
jgi:hypothetical protein